MYAATLAIMLVSVSATPIDSKVVADVEDGVEVSDSACDGSSDCGCGCGSGGHGGGRRGNRIGRSGGPMPQTCYAPRYGCYPGNNRHMHRYPAFHGVYYRRPINYRNLFDYPWHAELHEPTSLFSYHTPEEEEFDDIEPLDDLGGSPPTVLEADPVSVLRPTPARRPASALRPTSARRAVTLRRASYEANLVPLSETRRWRASDVHRRHRDGSVD